MKKIRKLLLVLPVVAAMILASIPVAANYSVSCYGGDNVGRYGNYEWSITIASGSGYAEGYGANTVNCYLNTWFYGTLSNTQNYSCSISAGDYYQVYSGGVNFYD